jgi:Tol biopolymer transport system component
MRVAPDGQSGVYISYDELRRIDILGGTPETIHTPVTSFKFSPDGDWIVFLSGGSLYKVPLNGFDVTLIGAGSEEYDISPDSSTIIYRTADMRELWAVGMNGGQPQRLSPELVAGGTLGMGTFSPDSSYVVYWAQRDFVDRMELFRVALELDSDGDSRPAACDQAPYDPASWEPASEVRDLMLSRTGSVAQLYWNAPESPGGLAVSYTILRGEDAAAFRAGSTAPITCLPDGDPDDLAGEDSDTPSDVFYYLIRADNGLSGMVGEERERGETWSCP